MEIGQPTVRLGTGPMLGPANIMMGEQPSARVHEVSELVAIRRKLDYIQYGIDCILIELRRETFWRKVKRICGILWAKL